MLWVRGVHLGPELLRMEDVEGWGFNVWEFRVCCGKVYETFDEKPTPPPLNPKP